MKVNHPTAGAIPAHPTQIARASGTSEPAQPVTPVRRSDSVRISQEGRALAQAVEPLARDPDAELTPEQIAELRRRVYTGAYDSATVVDAVARRILSGGDLETLPTVTEDAEP